MFPILQIGPVALRTSSLLILLGIYLGLTLAERRLRNRELSPNQLYNLVFLTLAAGALGARLSHAIQNYQSYLATPLNLISLDPSLLDPIGGAAAALICATLYGKRHKLDPWKTLDAITPGLAILAVSVGLAHAASGQAYGSPTTLPWGVDLWGAKRHPSQLYETLAAMAILISLWPRFKKNTAPGDNFLLFVVLSATARTLLEAWRGDSHILAGGLRQAQLISWAILTCGLLLLERNIKRRKLISPSEPGIE